MLFCVQPLILFTQLNTICFLLLVLSSLELYMNVMYCYVSDLFSPKMMILRFLHIVAFISGSTHPFYCWMVFRCIQLCECIQNFMTISKIVYPFISWSTFVFRFGLLSILLCIFVYKSLFGNIFLLLWGRYLGIGLQDHMLSVVFDFKKNYQTFLPQLFYFIFPVTGVWNLSLLHSLSGTLMVF